MTKEIVSSIIASRLKSISEEMGEAMLRTAYSQILNSARDFSTAIIDDQHRLVAVADHIPVHVGALSWATRALAAKFPTPGPGDIFLLNDPYNGGSHLPDLTIFVPVFVGDRLAFWSIVRAHLSDIGGATYGGYNPGATEIWQEGLRVPPIKLASDGQLRDDLIDLLAANVRQPREFRGDMAAMIGAAKLGRKRLDAAIEEFGYAAFADAVDTILNGSESYARAIISSWQDGVYYGEGYLDDDGHDRSDICIRAEVTVAGSDITIDLSKSDAQVKGFVNSSFANTQSAAAMAFAFLLDAESPRNQGTFRPVTVVMKQGTVVWPHEGAPVAMCTSHPGTEIIEAVVEALSGACPERSMAGWGKRYRIAIEGKDPRTDQRFIWHMFHARPGSGAFSTGDGWDGGGEWVSAGGTKFGSVEVAEARFPLFFEHHEFRQDSGGTGKYRGGLGAEMLLRVETAGDARANTAGDGIRHAARGRCGGSDGLPHDYTLIAPAGERRTLKTKEVDVNVPSGSVLHILSAGGGGWGER